MIMLQVELDFEKSLNGIVIEGYEIKVHDYMMIVNLCWFKNLDKASVCIYYEKA